jgi:hypothetical protein
MRTFIFISVMLALQPAVLAAPANDHCASATVISSIPQTLTTVLDGSSAAPADPVPTCYPIAKYNTVWYRYTPGADRQVSFDTSDSSDNSVIAVFTGSCSTPVQIDCDHEYGINNWANHGRVDFRAKGGTTYYVMVSSPFEVDAASYVTLEATTGQSAPITVTVREDGTESPLPGAHIWVRDTTGGNYTIRDGFTGTSGAVTLYPPMRGPFDLQGLMIGFQNDAAVASNASGPAELTLRLPRIGTLPAQPDRRDPPRLVGSDGSCITTLLPDGTDHRFICPGGQVRDPVFSPDGSRIAFFHRDYHGQAFQIFTVNADGTGLAPLFNTQYASAENLTWSPDGQWLAYDRFDPWNGFSSIYRVNVVTAIEDHLLDFGAAPRYSPDGSMIAYDGSSGVRIARADGSDPVMITSMFGNPAWSPDGRQIAVNYGWGVGANEGISVINVDGTGVRLVHGVAWEVAINPAWSADGKQIAFMDEELGDYYLTLVDVDDGDVQRIYEPDLIVESRIDWSRHPTYDVPLDRAPNVNLITPDGGERYRPGEEALIRWHASDDRAIRSQSVWLQTNGARTLLASGLDATTRSLPWIVPDLPSYCDAWIDIEVEDDAGQKARDYSRYSFSIAGVGQGFVEIALTSPTAGSRVEPGQQIEVTWNVDSYFSIGGFDLFLSTDGGFTWSYAVSGIGYGDGSTTWTVPNVSTSRAYLRILPISANGTTYDEVGPFGIGLDVAHGVSVERSGVYWDVAPGAASYDVVRGAVSAMRERRGGLGRVEVEEAPTCLANDAIVTQVADEAVPPAGEVWFYEVRPNGVATRRSILGMSSAGWEHKPDAGGCP